MELLWERAEETKEGPIECLQGSTEGPAGWETRPCLTTVKTMFSQSGGCAPKAESWTDQRFCVSGKGMRKMEGWG